MTGSPQVRTRRLRDRLAAVLAVAAIPGLAGAPGSAHAVPDPCGPDGALPAQVSEVSDTLELTLEDGRTILLAGIDPPRATQARPGLAADARRALAGWIIGREILVRPLDAAPDRWNRTIAMAFAPTAAADAGAKGSEGRVSLAQALLGGGWARAKPNPAIHACFEGYLATEARAREKGLGLWEDPAYAILAPDDREALADRAGGMVLVAGRLRVRSARDRTYAYLAPYPSPFRATLSRRAAKLFAKAGLDLAAFAGTDLRIRGFLDDRFGPRIDLVDPDQIESLEPGSLPASGATEGARRAPQSDGSASKQWTTLTQDR